MTLRYRDRWVVMLVLVAVGVVGCAAKKPQPPQIKPVMILAK